ncbi:MAG: imidazole glycerol phosphate synthase subunit HisH [Acidimicrobiales bacterium]
MTGAATRATQPRIAIVDYGIGNLRSAEKALQRVGAHAALEATPERIASAAGIVLPGVGAFGKCRQALAASDLETVVVEAASAARDGAGVPFLGICVGMQLLFDGSEESPDAAGLGLLPGHVRRLPPGVKHPQMQWNRLALCQPDHPLFAGLRDDAWMYFVHSYAAMVDPADESFVLATVDYGGPVVAAAGAGRLAAAQFHPEKSSHDGLALLGAFVSECASVVA